MNYLTRELGPGEALRCACGAWCRQGSVITLVIADGAVKESLCRPCAELWKKCMTVRPVYAGEQPASPRR